MKKIILAAVLICIIFWFNSSVSNPIVEHFINEFMFDSTGWKLELYRGHSNNYTPSGWCLTSSTDTGFLKPGICFNEEGYLVLTQDSLQSIININSDGDNLSLYDTSYSYYMDSSYYFAQIDNLRFGLHGDISAPKAGQSIGISPYENDEYILDNTPTIGSPNDSSNINGYVEGYIKDTLNNPIPGVRVLYDSYYVESVNSWIYYYVFTDSDGYFLFTGLSKLTRLEFEKNGFYEPDSLLQVWPDSTVTINITMSRVVGVSEIKPPALNKFELTQNFPNPFNSSTSFYYYLPEDEDLEIIIYDQKGEMVQELFKGFQGRGQYRINWNADQIASGIYFYELKAGSRKLVKKCLLLK